MNIFALDRDPVEAARMHCDKHVVKMVLETAQILSTIAGHGYKPTHKNHPCTRWAAESRANYAWLFDLGVELGREYTRRYGKRHKSSYVIAGMWPPRDLPDIGLTPFALVMPDEYKTDCPVESYRAYYLGEKAAMAKYKNGRTPKWMQAACKALAGEGGE